MTARVIPMERARRSGRQPAEVEAMRDLREELTALLAEDLDHARELLALTRSAMRAVADGRSPGTQLDAIERLVHRLTYQRKSAANALVGDVDCPDWIAAVGHGAAA